VHFSCKISKSVLAYLESEGEDLSLLQDRFGLPEEFLKDPSHWITATEMESFLSVAEDIYTDRKNLIKKSASSTAQLRSWGVLDSVLRLMPSMREIWSQPTKFLSYFISPEPPIDHFEQTNLSVAFDLPFLLRCFRTRRNI
jgi:hypothetical protein